MNEAAFYIVRLLDYFNVKTISELSKKIGVTSQAITNWKIRNSIRTLQKKCKELDIEEDIFSVDFDSNVFTTKNTKNNNTSAKDKYPMSLDASQILKYLMIYYRVDSLKDLGIKLGVSQSVVSNWRQRNSIGALIEKLQEVDPKSLDFVFSSAISHSQQHVNSNSTYNIFDFDENIQGLLESIFPQIQRSEAKKNSFIKILKEWLINNL